jgi:hypothetical protein
LVKADAAGSCPPVIQLSNGDEVDDISFHREGRGRLGYEVLSDFLASPDNVYLIGSVALINVSHSSQGNVSMSLQGQPVTATSGMTLPETKQRSLNYVAKGLYSGCSFHEGLIAELLLYQRELSTAEAQQVTQYLKTKWGCCS